MLGLQTAPAEDVARKRPHALEALEAELAAAHASRACNAWTGTPTFASARRLAHAPRFARAHWTRGCARHCGSRRGALAVPTCARSQVGGWRHPRDSVGCSRPTSTSRHPARLRCLASSRRCRRQRRGRRSQTRTPHSARASARRARGCTRSAAHACARVTRVRHAARVLGHRTARFCWAGSGFEIPCTDASPGR
jgi:hypothetical protein